MALAQALRSWTGLDVAEYKGGMSLRETFQVLVSTPDAFKTARRHNSLLEWERFRVVVFDEVGFSPTLHSFCDHVDIHIP